MRKILIGALSAGLLIPTAVSAADVMTPGKPAGVHAAQNADNTLLFLGLGVAAVVVVAVAVSSGGNDNNTPVVPTTTL